jgi:hypothetical protein
VGLDHTKAPDEVYFNVFGFLVHYPERWAVPLMAFVVLLFAGVAVLGFKRRQLIFGGIVLGFLALLGSMVVVALGVYLIWALIHALHPGGIWALQYKALLIWTGAAGLSVAITATLYAGFRKKIHVANLAVGALLWWLLLTVATAISFPPASYLFIWPLLFSLVGIGIFFALGDRATKPWFPFAALTLGAIPAVFLFVYAIYGVTATNGFFLTSAVPVFALAIVLLLGLLVPHLDLVAKPNRWVLPGAAAVLGMGLLLAGSLTAGFDARHPRPNSILYALNTDTGQAIWQSSDEEPDAWTAQFLGADARKGSVADYLGEAGELHSDAPTVALAAPNVALLDDGTRGGVRTLRMRATAPPKANVVVVEAGAEAQVVGAAVNGERLPEVAGGMPEWTLNYWDPPSGGVELTLEVKGAGPLTITARAGTPGLPDIPAKTYRDRPPDMMPIAWNSPLIEQDSSTVVSKSFTFGARPGNEEST